MFTEEGIKDIHCGSGILLRTILMNCSKEFINDTNCGSSEFLNWTQTIETDILHLPTQDGEIDYRKILIKHLLSSSIEEKDSEFTNFTIDKVDNFHFIADNPIHKKQRYDFIIGNPPFTITQVNDFIIPNHPFVENEQKIGKPRIKTDEDEYGISIAYIPNRVEKVYSFQKHNIDSFRKYKESEYFGIYFLVGKDNNRNTRVYVGYSQKISRRLNEHINKKRLWIDTYVLIGINNSLDKAQGDYLEKKFIELLLNSREITLDNIHTYQKDNKNTANLNDFDLRDTDDFFNHAKELLRKLGLKIGGDHTQDLF